jgi:hypothetical protein
MPARSKYPGESQAGFRNRMRRQGNSGGARNAVRPRAAGVAQRNRKGQMQQLMQDAMLGRQIRASRMQRNQARGNRRPAKPMPMPRRRQY